MSRYIVCHDVESTGLDKTKDRIIQYAALKYDTVENKVVDKLNLYIRPDTDYVITLQAYFKHRITPEFLKDKPTFKEVAKTIYDFIGDCDILSYNGCSFDNPFVVNELARCGYSLSFLNRKCYDAFLIEKRRNGNRLEETYERRIGKTMKEAGLTAHDAFSDVTGTQEVLINQKKESPVEPENILCEDNIIQYKEFEGKMCKCIVIGKYKDIALEYVAKYDQQYLQWCLSDKCSFSESAKNIIREYIK